MTEDEKDRLNKALDGVRVAFISIPDFSFNEELLYQSFKELHTAALAPFCTLCKIWEERRGLNPTERRRQDAINLDELFEKENGCGN